MTRTIHPATDNCPRAYITLRAADRLERTVSSAAATIESRAQRGQHLHHVAHQIVVHLTVVQHHKPTTTHLRTNLTTRALAALFHTSQSTVDRIFHHLIPVLADALRPAPDDNTHPWIIDGTLIPVARPVESITAISKNYRRSINTQVIIHQHHQMVWDRPGPAATPRWPLLNKQHPAHPRTAHAQSVDVAGPAENNQQPS
ncbi:hypothetical protein CKJ76_26050 [Mycobacterium avium]|nr:hypothetical protein CKJ76_26050 [Mycobacterium avium]